MTRVDIQIYVDSVLVSDIVAMNQKVDAFLLAEPGAVLKTFMFERVSAKVNVGFSVANVTIQEIGAIKTKIQNYLGSQPNSHQTLFRWVED